MNAEDRIRQLKENGETVYSHSRLSSLHNCEYEYYNTYILKNRGIDNIYTIMGSEIHNGTEALYKGEIEVSEFKENFNNKLIETEMVGVSFPNESIGASWKADMEHFLNNFKKLDRKMVLEKLIVFQIGDHWFQGYIDAISPSEKGKPYVDVIDWKTSSKFSGKKLKEAGRQLLTYKIGLEQTTGYKVDKLMWAMVKYVYVCTNGKTKVKKKMCNRGKWVKEMRKQFDKDLGKLGMDDFEIEMLLDDAIERNSIDKLPKEIQDNYWLEDCFVEYGATEENLKELEDYVNSTVSKIESKKPVEEEWKPVKIDKYNSFYCSVLCGHRKTCKFYKEFLDKNSNNFTKKKKDEDDFDLFG